MEKTEVKYVAADLSGLEDNPKLVPDTDFMTARSQLRKKKRRSCSLYAAVIALLATAGMFCVCLVWLYGSPRLGEDVLEEIEPARRRIEEQEKNNCFLEMDRGVCMASMQRWYYNKLTGRCAQFSFGGCGGNGNNFVSQEKCAEACETKSKFVQLPLVPPAESRDKDVCNLSPEAGPCRGAHPRFYFDSNSRTCMKFLYGGCAGNENKFLTEGECRARCVGEGEEAAASGRSKETTCSLPADTGMCRALMYKFYYDSEAGACQEFVYGGCGGNDNKFDTQAECEQLCGGGGEVAEKEVDWDSPKAARTMVKVAESIGNKKEEKVEEDVCKLPREVGRCRAAIPVFYYNSEAGRCERFFYGGCDGNGNRFDSEEECSARCGRGS